MTIEDRWVKLRELRRKVVAVTLSLKSAYCEKTLLQIFMRGLPQGYATAVDTLDMQDSLTVDDKIQKLLTVEERICGTESAYAAFRKKGSQVYVPPYRRRNSESSDEDNGCYLCNGRHGIKNCGDLDRAKKLVRQYRREQAA